MEFRTTSVWAGIISGGLSQWQDTKTFRNGMMSKKDYAAHTTKNITGAAGIVAGIEYGAMLGSSLMPGVGTIVGTIVGGMIGDRIGSMVGLQAGNMLFQQIPESSKPLLENAADVLPVQSEQLERHAEYTH